jgi:hypothetical protein
MSDLPPDPPPHASEARWVRAKVVAEDAPPTPPAATAPPSTTPLPAISDSELAAARWFSIAFLLVVIPLGLLVLGFVVWMAITNIPKP